MIDLSANFYEHLQCLAPCKIIEFKEDHSDLLQCLSACVNQDSSSCVYNRYTTTTTTKPRGNAQLSKIKHFLILGLLRSLFVNLSSLVYKNMQHFPNVLHHRTLLFTNSRNIEFLGISTDVKKKCNRQRTC